MEACVHPRQTGQLWHHSCCFGTTGWEYLKPFCQALSFTAPCVVSSLSPTVPFMLQTHYSVLTPNQHLHAGDIGLSSVYPTLFSLHLLSDIWKVMLLLAKK